MIKMIFYILIIGIFAYLFSDTFTDTFVMISTAITAITSALNVILAIIIVPFNSMLSFYYIKLALYIGVLFFVISYVLKLITGHHLMTEEDIDEEEQNTIYDKLKEKDWKELENEAWKLKNKDMIKLANDDSWLYEEQEDEDIETANARWNREYERRNNQW